MQYKNNTLKKTAIEVYFAIIGQILLNSKSLPIRTKGAKKLKS